MCELREIRIDMARFNDELPNTTKFFGDWHLARIYEKLSARFHLSIGTASFTGSLRPSTISIKSSSTTRTIASCYGSKSRLCRRSS